MNSCEALYNQSMWVANPENPNPELPIVWGILPEALHRHDPETIVILKFILSHHPQHYEAFVALLAAEAVWGKRIALLLRDIFLDIDFYNPQDFFNLMFSGKIQERIIELSGDSHWKDNWEYMS